MDGWTRLSCYFAGRSQALFCNEVCKLHGGKALKSPPGRMGQRLDIQPQIRRASVLIETLPKP